MLTAGVDLATEPARTALALVAWDGGSARVSGLALGVDDDAIVVAAKGASKLGVDCPLGWPDEFVSFVARHQDGGPPPLGPAPDGSPWWRRLAYRETDRAVVQAIGLHPLSVSTDRIGLTAMRAAGLLARLADGSEVVDRSGRGLVVEVYPAASLRVWGLPSRGYKGRDGRPLREQMLAALQQRAPWLHLGGHEALLVRSADCLDALVAALAARAAASGRAAAPAAGQLEAARREGWIAWPTCPLEELAC